MKGAPDALGRYSTGWGVSGSDALIQDFYALECQNPVRRPLHSMAGCLCGPIES
jgi:hypothetical protein